MPSVCFCPLGVSHYHAFSLLQPFKFFRFPSLLLCHRHARHHPLTPPRMPSTKKKGTKKLVKKFAPPLEASSASQELSQEPSQVWPPKTPSYLGPPMPLPSSSAAYQDSPDLFAEDVEIDPVGSPYSEQIPTPGCSVEHRPSAVVTLDKPRIQVVAAGEDDGNSDDPAMQQSGQDLSILERDWSEHSEEQAQMERDDDDASTDEGEVVGTHAKNISLTRIKEAEIVEWLQDNPFLYDRGHPLYKNKAKKSRTMEEQAKKLGLKTEELARWIHTKRTRFGKLTKMAKSGTGQTSLTQLDKWILKLFKFLGPHIVRQRDTKTLGIGKVRTNKIFYIYLIFFFFFFGAAKGVGGIVFFFLYKIQT